MLKTEDQGQSSWKTSGAGGRSSLENEGTSLGSSTPGDQSLVAPLLWVPGVLRSQGAWAHAMKETMHGPALAITPGVDLIDADLLASEASPHKSLDDKIAAKDQVPRRF